VPYVCAARPYHCPALLLRGFTTALLYYSILGLLWYNHDSTRREDTGQPALHHATSAPHNLPPPPPTNKKTHMKEEEAAFWALAAQWGL